MNVGMIHSLNLDPTDFALVFHRDFRLKSTGNQLKQITFMRSKNQLMKVF